MHDLLLGKKGVREYVTVLVHPNSVTVCFVQQSL